MTLLETAPTISTRPGVAIEGVSKVFGHGASAVVALDQVALSVPVGEFVCVVGASGCGKTTLLNLIAGLERPTAGRIDVAGRRIALMFQESALLPWLTASGNVELALRLRGVPKSERRRRAVELLERVHLGGVGQQRPHELSGGMRQRVALARALAQEADVLLMDEPFGALDAMTRDLLHDEVERVWSAGGLGGGADRGARGAEQLGAARPGERRAPQLDGLTVVFVTHNVREAVRLGDRVVLMTSRPGRVAEEFHIDLHRPRRIDSAELADVASGITDRLKEEVRRHGR